MFLVQDNRLEIGSQVLLQCLLCNEQNEYILHLFDVIQYIYLQRTKIIMIIIPNFIQNSEKLKSSNFSFH